MPLRDILYHKGNKFALVIFVGIAIWFGYVVWLPQYAFTQTVYKDPTLNQNMDPTLNQNMDPTLNQKKVKDIILPQIDFKPIPIRMSNTDKQIFAEIILSLDDKLKTEKKRYLEWGSGGSTELISILGTNINSKFYSIEHAPVWCDKMLKQSLIQYAVNIGKLRYECVDTGVPLGAWGVPALRYKNDTETISKMTIYVEAIDLFNESRYDIVLIDGRFRVDCAMKLLIGNYVHADSIIMIHDYYPRKQYHVVEEFYDIIRERKDTLAVFKVKSNFFRNRTFMQLAQSEFMRHRYDFN